jgi:type I restriction enzyme S subunit
VTLRVTPAEIVERAEAGAAPGLLAKAPTWTRIRLGDVARVVNGFPYPSRGFNLDGVGMPLIRIRDIDATRPSTWYAGDWEKIHLVHRGDILVGMDGDFRVATWKSNDALLNQRVCRIDVDEGRYSSKFLRLVLPGYLDAIWEATSSTTVKHLSSRSIADIPLPAPPLHAQWRIVEMLEDLLSRLEAASALRHASVTRLTALRRSSLAAVIDARERPRVPLAKLVSRIEAGRSFGGAAPPASPDEWGIVKVSAMTWGTFRADQNKAVPADKVDARYEIKSGDLLVSRANTTDYVGASVLVDAVRPRLLLSDKSLRLIPRDGVDPRWLQVALSTPAARSQISARATGTKESMRNISQGSLLSIAVPEVAGAQQAADIADLAGRFEAIDRLISSVDALDRRSTALRRGLLSAAFSGQLTGRASDVDRIEELAEVGA